MTTKAAQLSLAHLLLGEPKGAHTLLKHPHRRAHNSVLFTADAFLGFIWVTLVISRVTIPEEEIQGPLLHCCVKTGVLPRNSFKLFNIPAAPDSLSLPSSNAQLQCENRVCVNISKGSVSKRTRLTSLRQAWKPSQQDSRGRLESPTYFNENYSTLPLQRAYRPAKSLPLHAGNCYFLTKD